MDQTQIQQKIAEYYEKLPGDLQTVFSSMRWLEIVTAISSKYSLDAEQTKTLATETTLLLLCVVSISEYEGTLNEDLDLAEEIMRKILIEIDSSILVDIKPQLQETYNKNTNSLIEEKITNSGWTQNVDFILSGGDYSSFLKEDTNNIKSEKTSDTPQVALENFNLEITDGKDNKSII